MKHNNSSGTVGQQLIRFFLEKVLEKFNWVIKLFYISSSFIYQAHLFTETDKNILEQHLIASDKSLFVSNVGYPLFRSLHKISCQPTDHNYN